MPGNTQFPLQKDILLSFKNQIIKNEGSLKSLVALAGVNKLCHGIFQPLIPVHRMLTAVVEGNINQLVQLVKAKPALFFEKGDITAPRKQTYRQVSAYQLMIFLCDSEMKHKILSILSSNFKEERKKQYEEIGQGGADLIKVNFDPLSCAGENFVKLQRFEQKYQFSKERQQVINFTLLQNFDGIVYYDDDLYYANSADKSITKLDLEIKSAAEHRVLLAFKNSFIEMENNSGRRSSDKEYQEVITTILHCCLVREGIRYTWNGVNYRDACTPFRITTVYRTCIRLYAEASEDRQHADSYWRQAVGLAQGEEMWLLQRLCKNVSMVSVNNSTREFKARNWISKMVEPMFKYGKLIDNLGVNFALYMNTGTLSGWRGEAQYEIALNLASICFFIAAAKSDIVEFQQKHTAIEGNTALLP